MVQSAPKRSKINTDPTQTSAAQRSQRAWVSKRAASSARRTSSRVIGEVRGSSHDSDRVVMEVGVGDCGVAAGGVRAVAGGVRRGRAAAVPPGRDRGRAGGQAGECPRPAGSGGGQRQESPRLRT